MTLDLRKIVGLASTYVFADALVRGVHFLLIPLYTRYLAPAEYGLLALLTAVLTLLTQVLGLGQNGAVMRFYYMFEDPAERRQFFGSMWVMLVVLAGGAVALLDVVGGLLYGNRVDPVAWDPHVRLVLWTAFLYAAFRTMPQGLFRVAEQGRRFAVFSIGSLILSVTGIIWLLAVQGQGLTGVLRGLFIGAVGSAVLSMILLRDAVRPAFVLADMRRMLAYGLPLVPHQASHWLLGLSDRVIIERLVGAGPLGLYHLGYQFASAYQVLISAVNNAIIPRWARQAATGTATPALSRLSTYYVTVCLTLGLGIGLMAPSLISLLTPNTYAGSASVVPWVTAGVLMLGLYYIPMNFVAITVGHTRTVPFITAISGGVNIGLNLLFVPRFGILAAAVNTVVGYAMLLAGISLLARAVDRKRSLRLEWGRLGRLGLTATVVGVLAALTLPSNAWGAIALSIGWIATMPAVLFLLGFFTAEEKRAISRMLRRARWGL